MAHCQSIDFDFFTHDSFSARGLLERLRWLGRLEVVELRDNDLAVIEPGVVQLALHGGLDLQSVAEPSLVAENGLVVASVYDLAGPRPKPFSTGRSGRTMLTSPCCCARATA